ncbi:hypothetical protein ISN44_As09g007050 [Arabidopsis suecica]|uniref:Uncharacterized protein n=1 Tax=Arabidopsis suecica TaxID=45249 RepID=A0A8T2AH60_ARASU|nr:hypothetical protein ISN44_As09g007050 [Arabidopsis suecica]
MGFGERFEVYETESYGGDELKRNMKSLGELVSQIEETSGSIAMPMFDGTNPSLWFSKVEKFFNIGRFADEAKLDLVFLSLEGVALKWFLREMSIRKFRDWAGFEHRLFARFDPVKICATEAIHSISKLESEAKESNMEIDGVSQLKVSISPLEPSFKFRNESLDVMDAFSSVFFEQSQVVDALEMVEISEMSTSVKTTQCALQLFDKMLMGDGIRKQQCKLRKYPKAWRFKFKTKSRIQQLKYYCSFAQVRLVRKNKTFQSLRLKKQAHMSRVPCKLRMLHDPGGMKQLIHGDMKSGDETGIAQEVSKNGYIQGHKQIVGTNKKHPILCRIAIQAPLFTLSKLEGKLVFNGGSNGEAATGLGNEMFMFLQSFPVCFWTRSGLEIHGDMKLMFLSARESRESFRDSFVTPILQVGLEEIELQRLQDSYVVYVLSNIESSLRRLKERSSNSWKFTYKHESEGIQQHQNQFGPRELDEDMKLYMKHKWRSKRLHSFTRDSWNNDYCATKAIHIQVGLWHKWKSKHVRAILDVLRLHITECYMKFKHNSRRSKQWEKLRRLLGSILEQTSVNWLFIVCVLTATVQKRMTQTHMSLLLSKWRFRQDSRDLTHLGIARLQVWYHCKNKAGKLQPFSELMMWGFVHSRSGEGIGFLGLVNASLVAANGAFIIDAAATSLASQSIGVEQYRTVMFLCMGLQHLHMRLLTWMTLKGGMMGLCSSGCARCVFERCHRLTHRTREDQSTSALPNFKKQKFRKAWKFKFKQKAYKRDMAAYQKPVAIQMIQKLVVSFFLLQSLRTSLFSKGEVLIRFKEEEEEEEEEEEKVITSVD